jgi:TolB protein
VLTYSANSQIYVINADGTGLQQISFSNGIDTEPEWSPDGASIYFTSNRGGGPQIYRMPASGGDAKRVTFEGAYNVSPHLSTDGKLMTFIKQTPAGFKVAVQDLATGQVQTLSDTSQDESPSFAPNGRMILYATSIGGKGSLAAVSVDGRVKQRLKDTGGDVREPSWGSSEN